MAEKRKSRGVVVNFHDQKGFGFIKLDAAGEDEPDIFVHHSHLKSDGYRTLRPGQIVEFLLFKEADKLQAADVTVVGAVAGDVSGVGGLAGVGGGRGGGGYRAGGVVGGRRSVGVYDRRSVGVGGGGGGVIGGRGGGVFDRRSGNGYRSGGGGGGGGGGECYTCGNAGHFARDCYQNNGGNRGGGNESGVCYTCGGVGHLARECPTGRKRGCFNCGGVGHVAADCRLVGNGGGGRSGGGVGFSKFGGNVKACFNCGEQGHMAKDCQEYSSVEGRGNNNAGGGYNRQNCFTCGEPGHFARECTTVK